VKTIGFRLGVHDVNSRVLISKVVPFNVTTGVMPIGLISGGS